MNKTIRSCGRAVIYRVFSRCLAESQAGQVWSDIENVYQRTADMTGKSVNTVRKIVEEGAENNGIFSTPGKDCKGRPRKYLDDFDLCHVQLDKWFISFTLWWWCAGAYTEKFTASVREDLGYDGSREHLRKVLHSLGFSYKKCKIDRSALMEKPNIAAKREQYLKIIMDNRNLPLELQKEIIYLDESYIHSSYNFFVLK